MGQWGQTTILVTLAGPVGANNTSNLAWLDAEADVVQRLKRGAFYNRLTCEPPPLVEHGGFQALQLAKLVFFGDVVDFDDGHSYLKSSLLRPGCLRIEANVPNGISFLGSGTINTFAFRYPQSFYTVYEKGLLVKQIIR